MMTLCRFLRLTSAQDTRHYRAPTKLRKGNVFSRFCLSVILSGGGGGVSHVTITYDALDLTVSPPTNIRPGTPSPDLP